jgi:hypothetical protein
MNEALLSALPVFMTNVSPNNFVLPEKWLIDASKTEQLMTRTMLDVYSGDPVHLAHMVDKYINIKDKTEIKEQALILGVNKFAPGSLLEQYQQIIKGESI